MKEDKPTSRRARRITDRSAPARPGRSKAEYKTVGLDLLTYVSLEAHIQERGISARSFVSAAVSFFLESGIDPLRPRTHTLDSVADKLDEVQQNLRQQNAHIGNRLVEIMRAWEKQLYTQLSLIQASHITHLERVEANLLNYIQQLHRQSLMPILEEIIRHGLDANIARKLCERIFLHLTGVNYEATPQVGSAWHKQHAEMDAYRNQQVVAVLKDLLEKFSEPEAQVSARSALVPIPPPAAPKSASTVPPAAPTPAGSSPKAPAR